MSNISFTACGRCARTTVCEPITTGSVGLSVSFAFDAAWIGLQKTAIFRGSGMAVDLVLSGDSATVPPEVLTIPGGDLRVGVWGADPDGNVIIPTVWATVGEIVPGAAPSGIDPQPPAPSWAAQVQEIARNALNTANSVREDADAGEFDGATYTPAVSAGGDLSWTNDKGKPNPPTVNIKGQEGQPGQTGATPDISIGTVTTGAAGSQASATMTGTPERPVLNLTIPKGDPGEVTQAEFAALSEEVADQKSAFDKINLFDSSAASIISVMGNASGGLVRGGGVSSVAIPVCPSTEYTLSLWGGNRRLVWETVDYPAVGGTWAVNDGEMSVSSETVDGKSRYRKTITTGATTHYLLLYFYTETTGAEDVLGTIQLEKGSVMSEFGLFSMPKLIKDKTLSIENAVPDSKAVGDAIQNAAIEKNYTNLFDKSGAEIVSIAVNASTLAFVRGGGASSVIAEVEPNTTYTIAWKSIGSNSRFFVAPSANVPVIGGTASARIELTAVSADGRHYGTLTTSATDHYLLLWFFSETTGGEETLNSIQINLGDALLDYTAYGFVIPDLNISTDNIFGDGFSLDLLPDYVVNLLGYRALGALDKGYICLVADDGTADIASVSFPISQNKQVPITFALWSTSACVTDASLLSQLRTMLSDYGCSVAQHGVGNFATGYTVASLLQYLANEASAWQTIGIEPKGIVYPNHGHNADVRTICGSKYGVGCTGGAAENKDHVYPNDTLGTRSNMFALYRVSTYSTSEATLKTMCDYAAANNKLLIIWWHDNDIVSESSQIAKINNVIDYAKTKGLEFVNVGDIPNL